MAILCGSDDHIKWPSCCLSWRQKMSSVGAARKISPNWQQETMTCHSSNCFSIVWGQGNTPLVTSLPSSCYMTHIFFFLLEYPEAGPVLRVFLHPHTNSPISAPYISLKNICWREFEKRSKHFLSSFLLMMTLLILLQENKSLLLTLKGQGIPSSLRH